MSIKPLLSAWVVLLCFGLGCAGNLQLTRINSEQRKPNNVWVFFTAQKGEEPVAGLGAEHFKIYEDDALVSPYESKQVIQNPEIAAVMYTLLLLDVSGSITESGQIEALVDAAEMFSERVGKTQKVAVYAFDGADKIHGIVPFTQAEQAVKGGLAGLRSYKPRDPSTNLHGAVVQGLQRLKTDLDRDRRPLKFGTLVVFSDGADRAARVSREDMRTAIADPAYENYDLFAIGIGEKAELEQAQLTDIGRDGTEQGDDRAKVKDAFDRIAGKIESHTKRFYLLSYCTPAREGEHVVRIEIEDEKIGKGSLEYNFQAAGFGPPPDCDPERQPTFSLKDVQAHPEQP
ncbi:MAG TPA: vWA domain-containing protein [Polyangiaceae bacterium]|nr:vWA domain-containing protein [Polyangiaceae bacterium]